MTESRELLDEERLPDHDLVDRFFEQLGEARHVHTLLSRIQVDGAVDLGGDQLLGSAPAQANRLADALDACARQPESHLGRGGLQIVEKVP